MPYVSDQFKSITLSRGYPCSSTIETRRRVSSPSRNFGVCSAFSSRLKLSILVCVPSSHFEKERQRFGWRARTNNHRLKNSGSVLYAPIPPFAAGEREQKNRQPLVRRVRANGPRGVRGCLSLTRPSRGFTNLPCLRQFSLKGVFS
jgi:hypothetical protein